MPRKPRVECPSAIYHIMSSENLREQAGVIGATTSSSTMWTGRISLWKTTLTLKAMATRVGLGSSKSANEKSHRWMAQQSRRVIG